VLAQRKRVDNSHNTKRTTHIHTHTHQHGRFESPRDGNICRARVGASGHAGYVLLYSIVRNSFTLGDTCVIVVVVVVVPVVVRVLGVFVDEVLLLCGVSVSH
jgi:hypothetical protein